jgi:hypothetical protein
MEVVGSGWVKMGANCQMNSKAKAGNTGKNYASLFSSWSCRQADNAGKPGKPGWGERRPCNQR